MARTAKMLLISIDPGWRNMGVVAFRNTTFLFSERFDLKIAGKKGQETTRSPLGCAVVLRGFVDRLWTRLDCSLAEEIRLVVESNSRDMAYTTHVPTALACFFAAKTNRRNELPLPIPRQRLSAVMVQPTAVLAWLKRRHRFKPRPATADARRTDKKAWTVEFVRRVFPVRPNDTDWTPDEADAALNAFYAMETDQPAIDLIPPTL